MKRICLVAVIYFLPIFSILWLVAPWSTSDADFELVETTLVNDVDAVLEDLPAINTSISSSVAWLQSREAATIMLGSLPSRHASALTEADETWNATIRERARALACHGTVAALTSGDDGICSWLHHQTAPEKPADQIQVVQARLSVRPLGDDGVQGIKIAFRAADRTMGAAVVDTYGDVLLEHHHAIRQEMRRRVIEGLQTEFAETTERETLLAASLARQNEGQGSSSKEEPALSLLTKFIAAMKEASARLPDDERASLVTELQAAEAVARNQPAPPEPKMMITGSDRKGALPDDDDASAQESLDLLSHPDWSNPPVVRLSQTSNDGVSVYLIAAMAGVLSFLVGLVTKLVWQHVGHQEGAELDQYMSPYTNPHWPNMRV